MSENVPCIASIIVLFGGLTTLNGLFSRRDALIRVMPLLRTGVTGDAVIRTVSITCDAKIQGENSFNFILENQSSLKQLRDV